MKEIGLILILVSMIMSIPGSLGCTSQEKVNMPIVLLTDFGTEDYRVAQLEGIIYTHNPAARLIVASHDVPAFDIKTGAFMLDVAAREFPANVVFIAVIAPYTQPVPRYLVLTTEKDQVFVLPDNGLLTYVVKDMGIKSIYRISNQALFEKPMQYLVAERIQGAVGALVASGYQLGGVGVPADDFLTFDMQEPAIAGNSLQGTIVYIDHFGNAITNISREKVNQFGLKPGDSVELKGLKGEIVAKYGTIYADVAQGKEIIFVSNNLELLQISINLGNFADKYSAEAGMEIGIDK